MAKKFKHKKVKPVSLYSYHPKDKLLSEEKAAYQRLILVSVFILLFSTALYLWGIPIVATLGSFWSKIGTPQMSSRFTTTPTTSNLLLPPSLNSLPSLLNNLKDFKVSGQAKAGEGVAIFINDEKVVDVLADASGRFEAKDLSLIEGENKIYARTQGVAEQTSKSSITQIVIFDKTPPSLEILEPASGAEFEGKDERWLEISGTTEPGVTVQINEHQAIVDLEGNFHYQYALSEGENLLKITACDEAGNETTVERTVKYSTGEEVTPTLSPFLTPTPTPQRQ